VTDRPANQTFPRYFVVQKDCDIIILDVQADRYYWKENTRVDELAPDADNVDDRAVKLDLDWPLEDGHAPRGPDRYWRFDAGMVLKALAFLTSAHWMVSKGFSGFAARLDRKLASEARAPRTHAPDLARIAAAIEWARLLFPFEAKCLPIAVATARMARSYGLKADVMVGVQALPLQAHAWAQIDDALINDFLDRVHRFKPIMRLPLESGVPDVR
jgi:hypothetical protein